MVGWNRIHLSHWWLLGHGRFVWTFCDWVSRNPVTIHFVNLATANHLAIWLPPTPNMIGFLETPSQFSKNRGRRSQGWHSKYINRSDWYLHILGIYDWVSGNPVALGGCDKPSWVWLVFWRIFPPKKKIDELSRGLDSDLQVLAKAGEPFDWERVSFVLEACGIYMNILSRYL